MSVAPTETVVAIAEIDAVLPADVHRLAASLTRAVTERRGHLELVLTAVPFPAALERQHIAVLLTYRPEQLPGKAIEQVCSYAADLALPGLRRDHGQRARLCITPVAGPTAVDAHRLLDTPL